MVDRVRQIAINTYAYMQSYRVRQWASTCEPTKWKSSYLTGCQLPAETLGRLEDRSAYIQTEKVMH